MRYIVKRILGRAGIKKNDSPPSFTLQLRYTYGNGAPLEVIQSLLGHEKSETTTIYAHLSGKLRHLFL